MDIKKINFFYPTLLEQEQIVAKLDVAFVGIDKVIKNTKHNLNNIEFLYQSILDNNIHAEKKNCDVFTINEVCILGDGNHSSKYPKKAEMIKSGIPFLRSTNIVDGKISDKKLIFISEKKHLELKKGHIREGDILLTNRGAGIGEIAIVDSKFNNCNLNSQIAWLRCKDFVINHYLFYYFLSSALKKIIRKAKSGTALPQLTITEIKKIKIYLPHKKRQTEMIKIFNSLEKSKKEMIFKLITKLNNLNSLKIILLEKFLLNEIKNKAA